MERWNCTWMTAWSAGPRRRRSTSTCPRYLNRCNWAAIRSTHPGGRKSSRRSRPVSCGKDRQHPDGLCIHPQQVVGREDMVAAPWRLHAGLADEDGVVAREYLWAALDCPGYFACAPGEAALLARLTVSIVSTLKAEGDATVIGWDLSGAGRKRRCGTAVFAPDGSLVAKAEGLWIVVDPSSITA